MSGFLTDWHIEQHNTIAKPQSSFEAIDKSYEPRPREHSHETGSVADTVLSSLRLEEMIPSGILDGDSIWDEPVKPEHIYGATSHFSYSSNGGIGTYYVPNGGILENTPTTKPVWNGEVTEGDAQHEFHSSYSITNTNEAPELIRQAWEAHQAGQHPEQVPSRMDHHTSHRHKHKHRHHRDHRPSSSSGHRTSSRRNHRQHHSTTRQSGHTTGSEKDELITGGTRRHHHHSRHHHQQHCARCRRRRSSPPQAPEMMEKGNEEMPVGKDWVKQRNRYGYRTRRSGSRGRTMDEEEFPNHHHERGYVDHFEMQQHAHHHHRRPAHHSSRRGPVHHRHVQHHRRSPDKRPSPPRTSNDFLTRDPAIHSVTFKSPESNRSSPSKKHMQDELPLHRYEPPKLDESARAGNNLGEDRQEEHVSFAPPALDKTVDLKTDNAPGSREMSPSGTVSVDLGVSSSDGGEAENGDRDTASPEKEASVPEKAASNAVTKLLLEKRAASEFIAGIEKDSGDEQQIGVSDGLNVNDPLSALSRMQPISDKLPTLLQDDRARDEIIFQDEEFKFYRETNMPLGVRKDPSAEIRHTRTDADGAVPGMYRRQYDEPEPEGVANVIPQPISSRTHGPPPRMNYFVALRVTDAQIRRNIESVQNRLIGMSDEFGLDVSRSCVDLSTLHLTLNMLYLGSDEMVFNVMEAFERFGQTTLQRLVPTKTRARLTIGGVSTFKNRVLFAKIVRDEHCDVLENLAIALRTMFHECGVVRQTTRFDPHLTIMKMSRISSDSNRSFPKELIEEAQTVTSRFGCQYIHGLELCSLHDERDDDDYYTSVAQIAPLKAF